MKKIILGAVALVSTLLGTAAYATPVVPPHVTISEVLVGDLAKDQTVVLSAGNKAVRVYLTGCDINWNTNDVFYLLQTPTSAVVVQKYITDFAWSKAEGNWNAAFGALVNNRLVCDVTVVR